jgi:hypothetical protein
MRERLPSFWSMPRRSPERLRHAAIGLALGVLLATSSVRAQLPAQVSVSDGGSPVLARKVRAEASDAGFAAVPARPSFEPAGVISELGSPTVIASIRVASEDRVELRVVDGDGSIHAQELVRSAGEGDSFALRIIEQLRALCVDLGWQLPPERVVPSSSSSARDVRPDVSSGEGGAPPLDSVRPAAPGNLPASTLWLDAGVAASWAVGGLGVTPEALLGARSDFASTWGASLTAVLPLASDNVTAPEGAARISWQLFAAALDYAPSLPAAWLASAGVGAGLLVVDVRGAATGDFEGRRSRLLAGTYFVELCAGHRLTNWLRLRATLLTGLSAPRPVLHFDEREVASLGRWFGLLGLSLDIGVALTPAGAP